MKLQDGYKVIHNGKVGVLRQGMLIDQKSVGSGRQIFQGELCRGVGGRSVSDMRDGS